MLKNTKDKGFSAINNIKTIAADDNEKEINAAKQ